jgi:glutaredoxin
MYTLSNCADCIKAKKLMSDNNIAAEIIDLDKMPSYSEIVDETTTP